MNDLWYALIFFVLGLISGVELYKAFIIINYGSGTTNIDVPKYGSFYCSNKNSSYYEYTVDNDGLLIVRCLSDMSKEELSKRVNGVRI